MPNILVVTGSIRPNSVNQKVVPLVVAELEKQGATATIADLGEINMPFIDTPVSPAAPDFVPEYDSVKQWTQLVADADGVLFVTPEYNHMLTPIQSNAIDWISKEWENKKIAFVGYGWGTGAGQAQAAAREAFTTVLKAHVVEAQTNLFFTKELTTEGDVIDQEAVDTKIAATVSELLG